jgi:hypothetical protein
LGKCQYREKDTQREHGRENYESSFAHCLNLKSIHLKMPEVIQQSVKRNTKPFGTTITWTPYFLFPALRRAIPGSPNPVNNQLQ